TTGDFEIREADAPDIVVAVVGLDATLDGNPAGSSTVTFADHQLSFRAWPSQVTGLALSPDGQRLYSCGEDGGLRAWNLTAAGSHWLARDAGVIRAIAVDPDGVTVWTAGADGVLRAYRDGIALQAVTLSHLPLLAVCSSGQRVYAAGEDRDIHEFASPEHRPD